MNLSYIPTEEERILSLVGIVPDEEIQTALANLK